MATQTIPRLGFGWITQTARVPGYALAVVIVDSGSRGGGRTSATRWGYRIERTRRDLPESTPRWAHTGWRPSRAAALRSARLALADLIARGDF